VGDKCESDYEREMKTMSKQDNIINVLYKQIKDYYCMMSLLCLDL
jgi:hypothetical protein